MTTANVSKVVRQQGNYRQFVEFISAGQVEEAFAVEGVLDNVHELEWEERRLALADDYLKITGRRKSAVVIAPTHAECNAIAEGIRSRLKEHDRLRGGVEWDVLQNLSWTEAQKSDHDHFKRRRGLVVQINGHVKGFALGERLDVAAVSEGKVFVRGESDEHGKVRILPLKYATEYDIYERAKLEVCAGEQIRITGNSRTADGRPEQESGNRWRGPAVVTTTATFVGYVCSKKLSPSLRIPAVLREAVLFNKDYV